MHIHPSFDAKPTTGLCGQRALFSCHLTIALVAIQVPRPFSKPQPFTFVCRSQSLFLATRPKSQLALRWRVIVDLETW
ncbi:hypothetical protein J4Q44_G00285490 [Coregonus suidteri]|uniref:Uncharacterized protein n=1 Tax=Coregonus suidteri TaxID=861788 RepID=A0AAN8LFH0_9TELE